MISIAKSIQRPLLLLSGICTFALLCAGCAQTTASGGVQSGMAYDFPEPRRDAVFAEKKVLVIVPHEDDEVCLTAGLLESYVAAGSVPYVVYVTNGDFKGGDIGVRRINEAIDALAECGIPEQNAIFLGYGDLWQGTQLYHAEPDAPLTSYGGFQHTYGSPAHPAYRDGERYTRNHLKAALRAVIEELRADTIFCVDFGVHPDHRTVSLLFEEVMGELLGDDPSYTPAVFKGFCYSTAWFSADDFYAENMLSTRNPYDTPYMREMPAYEWRSRVRFPIARAALGRLQCVTSSYRMLEAYASQCAISRGGRTLSGDRVFWRRETGSLLYAADISASSGSAARLNDFKLIDTSDVMPESAVLTGHVWSPAAKDSERLARVELAAPAVLTEIRLYDNPDPDANVLDAEIVLSNGTRITTGPLAPSGAPTIVPVAGKGTVSNFTLRILSSEGTGAGLCELEAYARGREARRDDPRWVKLVNCNDDFVYDYWIAPAGSERFTVYTYPAAASVSVALADAYTLETDGTPGCAAVFDGSAVAVTCPQGGSMTLRITDKADPARTDAVRISNPSRARRRLARALQRLEQRAQAIRGWLLELGAD